MDAIQLHAFADEILKIAAAKKRGKSSVVHKYVGPMLGGGASAALLGAALAKKGGRRSAAGKGALAGAAGSLAWKAVTRGYAKATGVPYKEVVA